MPDPAAFAFLSRRRSYPARTLAAPAPDRAELRLILTAALRVPDHGALTPWRFVVLERPDLDRVATIAERRGAELGLAPDIAAKGPGQFLRSALCVAVIASPRSTAKIPLREQELSAGALCLGLVNAALARGWGAAWITGWVAHDRGFCEQALSLTPDEFIAGFVHLGTPTGETPERPRPDVDALTRWGLPA